MEVCLDGLWGTVCEVDYSDATVICRTAGFDGGIDSITYLRAFHIHLICCSDEVLQY